MATQAPTGTTTSTATSGATSTILVVDDNTSIRKLLALMLTADGYQVQTAGDAEEALKLLEADPPLVDLILMDIAMPRLNGFEACRRIKGSERLRHIPVVFATASGTSSGDLETAFSVGATDFISKPINRTELRARVRSAITLKLEMDARRARERELLDVTQRLEVANRSLEQLAAIDPLTQLANRRQLDAFLDGEWRRAQRASQPISLLFFDIDFFKSYNDQFGHLKGDECLRLVAAALASVARRGGELVARYGGEEFAIVLPTVEMPQALALAEQARAAVVALAIPHPRPEGPILTISVGVATQIPTAGTAAAALVQAADTALYAAKREGRNRVVKAPQP